MSQKNEKIEEKIEELKESAMEEGEAFIGTLTPEDLREMGFDPIWGDDDDEFFSSFSVVDIYLAKSHERFFFEYNFLDEYGNTLDEVIEDEEDLTMPNGNCFFWDILKEYLHRAG